MEIRTIRSSVEVSSQRRLKGYAVRYDSRSTHYISPGVKERIAKGAFARSLGSGSDVRALFEHQTSALLGRTSSGTLQLRSDDDGLGFDLSLPNTQLGNDVYELCKRGDIRGMSFGFRVNSDDFAKELDDYSDDYDSEEDGSVIVRTVRDADLIEISAVSEPCYESSSVLARSMVDPRVEARAKEYAEKSLTPEQVDMRNIIRLAIIKGSMNLQ